MMTEYTDTNEPSFHSTPASEALVRDMRKRIEADTVERIAAWLRDRIHEMDSVSRLADAIERGDWKDKT